MRPELNRVGVGLHERATEILTAKGQGVGYSAAQYLSALAQAEAEGVDHDVPRSDAPPDEDALLSNAIGTVTARILKEEGREDDSSRYIEIFTVLARRHALAGFLNPNETE